MGTTFSSCFYDFPRIIMLYIIFFFVVCYFGFFLPDVKWCKCSLLCAYVYTGIKNFKEVIQLRHKYTLLPFVRLNYVSFAHRTFPQNKWYSIPKIVLYTFFVGTSLWWCFYNKMGTKTVKSPRIWYWICIQCWGSFIKNLCCIIFITDFIYSLRS